MLGAGLCRPQPGLGREGGGILSRVEDRVGRRVPSLNAMGLCLGPFTKGRGKF